MTEQFWHHDTIDTNGIKLHYVTQGEGDLMLFLHSDKPQAPSAYVMSEFVEDVKGVIAGLGYESCVLVGHDWGGAISWSFAYAYPELVSRLIVMNLPHPAKFAAGLKGVRQRFLHFGDIRKSCSLPEVID